MLLLDNFKWQYRHTDGVDVQHINGYGQMQQKRAGNPCEKKCPAPKIVVFLLHETFPDILLGASHNSYEDDEQRLREE